MRGEVIVFKNPNNESEFYIKRIIGLPGESVDIMAGKVWIDGAVLAEDYLPVGIDLHGESPFKLDADEYFVMGDNRPRSFDSRNWGPLKKDEIIGTVRLRFWPLNDFTLFSATASPVSDSSASK